MAKIGRYKSRPRHGAVVVEAAIIFPVLLMVTLGVIEYGWLLLNAQWISDAARQGARYAILPYNGAEAHARSVVNQMLVRAQLSDNNPVVTITRGPIPGDPNGRSGETVSITVPTATLLIVNAPLLFPVPANLRATVTMANEG